MENPKIVSNISGVYPALRDENPKNIYRWLDGKRIDDRAEDLWRIHDMLYDFRKFASYHPGGADWLHLTKGTDITEAFESHHISKLPQQLLNKYAVRKAANPRLYKFTYEEDGFYRTLRRRVRQRMATTDDTPKIYSKIYNDILIGLVFIFAILTAKYVSYKLATITGLALALLVISGHNFLHQRNNWRRKVMNAAFLDYREWQISHILSHHLYTNSLHDLEISLFEPIFVFLSQHPDKQKFFKRYGPILYAPLVYAVLLFATVIERYSNTGQKFYADHLLPLTIPLLMWLTANTATANVIGLTLVVFTACSFYFYLVGFTAAHHHPDTSRDGDILCDNMDWGLYQMATVAERSEVGGWQFLTQTHFGEHIMHHLFPTLDHGLLPQLKPDLVETCKEFGIEMAQMPWWRHVVGKFRQLARLEVNDFSKKKQ